MRWIVLASTAATIVFGGVLLAIAEERGPRERLPFVEADGTIRFPGRVRDEWVHLGSWGSADLASADPGQHDVYTQPESLRAYRDTGRFPDGAVIVKEVRTIESAHMTTGPVTWAGDEVLWFVMIKDSQNRFPDHEDWGEGWGWALFKAEDTATNASANFRASCLGCHVPAQPTDWIYVQGYPALRAAHAQRQQD